MQNFCFFLFSKCLHHFLVSVIRYILTQSPHLQYISRASTSRVHRTPQIYRVCINYLRISLLHNLSRKCLKIVKFVSITHSERNICNGPIVATAISREKRKQCWREMAASPTELSWCVLEFFGGSTRFPTAIWTSWSSWDVDPKVVWTIWLQRMHLSSSSAKYSHNLYSPCICLIVRRSAYSLQGATSP
jgi:hypothetical protein